MPIDIEEWDVEDHWSCNTCKHSNLGRFETCQNCGKPKENEEDIEPTDVSASNAVRDAELLRIARGGADWHCRFCSSSQRNADGQCANCTANKSFSKGTEALSDEKDDQYTPPSAPPTIPQSPQAFRRSVPYRSLDIIRYGLLGVGMLFLLGLLLWLLRPREYDARVADVYFQHVVHIDKYKVLSDQGFNVDADAFDVENEGQRVSHHERVQRGTRIEHYTVQVRDGQSCHKTQRTCQPVGCTKRGNGFSKCSKVCSGGDNVCYPKWKEVEREREVPRYVEVPVYHTWYRWKVWRWVHDRDVFANGHSLDTTWPTNQEIGLCQACSPGEQERILKDARYTVTFQDKDDSWHYTPSSEADFKKFKLGTHRHIKVTAGSVSLLE